MKLQYIWVEKYNEFESQEFNFTSANKFAYNSKNKELKHYVNDGYSINFFSNPKPIDIDDKMSKHKSENIDDIIAIVGNNGAGKSTILEMIMNFANKSPYQQGKYIAIITEDIRTFKIISNIDSLKKPEEDANEGLYIYGEGEISELDKLNIIYHSNAFDYRSYEPFKYGNINDISTTGLIKQDYKKYTKEYGDNSTINPNKNFFLSDFKRQIDFVANFDKEGIYTKFKLPNILKINYTDLNEELNNIYTIFDNIDEYSKTEGKSDDEEFDDSDSMYESYNESFKGYPLYKKKIKEFHEAFENIELNLFKSNKIKDFFVLYSIHALFFDMLKKYPPTQYGEDEYSAYYNIFLEMVNPRRNIEEVVKIVSMGYKDEGDAPIEIYDHYFEYMLKLNEIIKSDVLKHVSLDYDFKTLILDIKDKRVLEVFIEQLGWLAFEMNVIKFSWMMSSGENNLLSLFSRFYSIRDKNERKIIRNSNTKYDMYFDDIDKEYDYMVLIDEADLSYHPEWQQEYINTLINFLNKIYHNISLQIIITTHSPILLSDIPNKNVIYLSKERNGSKSIEKSVKTFGANIYNLYNDSFFLNKHAATGIIGTFATNKILDIMKRLDEWIMLIEENAKGEGLKGCNESESKIKIKKDLKNTNEIKRDLEEAEKIICLIGDRLLKKLLEDKYIKVSGALRVKTKLKDDIIDQYESLSAYEKKKLIEYIINSSDKQRG